MNDDKRTTVVLVEDNDVMRTLLRGILRAEKDYEVIGEARNGEAGVEMIKRLRPDLVCLDVMMPIKTGLDVLREIRPECAATRVVMVTGNTSKENVEEAIQNGACAFIVKPFRAATVLATLENVRKRTNLPAQ